MTTPFGYTCRGGFKDYGLSKKLILSSPDSVPGSGHSLLPNTSSSYKQNWAVSSFALAC